MADYPRITGTIAPTPRNRISGYLADLLEMAAKGYDVGSILQAGGPVTEGRLSTPLSDMLGVPELQRTLNRVSYNEPLTTGTGYTTRLRPDTVSAAMTVAPMVGPAAKAGAAGARMAGTALKDLATSDVAYNAMMNSMRRSGGMAELTAYHGTPHRFAPTEANPLGEFRSSQIGTGEGAQAYGHGLYLAEDRGLADVYRKKLTGVDGVPVSNPNDSLQMKIGRLQFEIDRLRQSGDSSAPAMIRAYEGRIKELNDAGSLYKVDLPDPMIEKMLHWDKPLSQQSKAVQEALKGIEKNLPSISDFDLRKWMDTDPLASTWHNVLNRDLGVGQPEIAALLQKKGVPGVQYFAAESRGSGGARNFVIFPNEEKNLTILKRE